MEAINWRHSWGSGTLREDMMTELKNHGFFSDEKPTVKLRKSIDDDTISFSTYRHAILSPKFRNAAYLAFRVTVLVVFPLMVIAEKYSKFFLMHTILSLFGIISCKDTVGEQVAMIIMVLQVFVWLLVWGSFLFFSGVLSQPIAWWITLFLVTFVLALFGDLRCRRLAILFTVLMMAAQLAHKEIGLMFPLIMVGNLLIALPFAFFQVFIPPFMMSKRVDNDMADAFVHVGNVVRNATKACWSLNPVEALEALTKTTLRPLRSVFSTLPPQLEIVRYEPMESTLRWQLRVERVDLLCNLMPMLYALSGVSHELHFVQHSMNQRDDNTEKLKRKCVFEDVLRERLNEALQPFLDAFDATVKKLGCVLDPADVVANVPFDDLKEATSQLQSAIDKIHFDVMSLRINPVEPVWYMHIVFAHLMMVLLGEELLKYFELMRNFDRSRYLSTGRCLLNFFFIEYWNDFRKEFPKRIKLATPRDVRLAKDGFKLAVAYTLGSFFSLYVDTENPYYFGMTILMGVGLPTAGDTLVAGMQRVAGLLFAIAIAFLVNKFHKTVYDKYAFTLLAIMLALFTRVFPAYLNCSLYCAILIPLMVSSILSPQLVLSRLVSNSLTVMMYYAIVVFIFPIDTIKVLQNTEVKIMNHISENISELMVILNSSVDSNNSEVKNKLSIVKQRSSELWATVRRVQGLIRTAAAEPILRGSPYPVHEQDEFEPVLHHIVASLDIIVLGLTCIHRPRIEVVDKEFEQVLSSIVPSVQNICVYGMHILQDFVDAVQVPKEWSYSQAVKNFSALMQLNNELRNVFSITHQNIMAAIRGKAREIRVNNLRMSMRFVNSFNAINNKFPELCEEDLSFFVNNESNEMDDQENEREELTAPRNASFLLRPEEFTINHDMNMSIAILVGIDLFCSELEKTLRIMFHLNKFELDRRYKLHKKNE